jgi:hypothetical protein
LTNTISEFIRFLNNPITAAGLFLLIGFLIARVVIRRETIHAWRSASGNPLQRLISSNYLIPVLGMILVIIGAVSTQMVGLSSIPFGEHHLTYDGSLKIAGGQAFLIPDPNQSLPDSILMMMRDLPQGGTPNERIDSAPSYFTVTLQKVNGDRIEVTGSLAPFGSGQVLVVDQQVRRP